THKSPGVSSAHRWRTILPTSRITERDSMTSLFARMLRLFTSSRAVGTNNRRPKPCRNRLRAEPLEPRNLLATYSFTNFELAPGAASGIVDPGAFGINDAGEIAETFSDGSGYYSFLKDGDTYTPINATPLGADARNTYAKGINNLDQIVGGYRT